MKEATFELYSRHAEHQSKVTYFLLAASGVCLAFSMTQVDEIALLWPNQFLLASIFFWAFSVFAGLRVLRNTGGIIGANYQMLKFQNSIDPSLHGEIEKLADEVSFEPINRLIIFWSGTQLYSLLAGALGFFVWKVSKAYESFEALLNGIHFS